jgi:glycosyltransferase involved in cell wall biosynthesis
MVVANERPQTLIVLEDSSVASLGGGQRVTLEVIRALRDRYDRILLFDYTGRSVFQTLAGPLVNGSHQLTALNGKLLPKSNTGSTLALPLSLLFCLRLILKSTEEENSESTLVYAATSKAVLLAYLLFRTKRFSYVFHAHLVYRKTSPFYWFLRPAFTRAGLILCVSKAVMRQLPGRRRLLYNAVELPAVEPKRLPAGKVVVATFSNLVKFKGIRYFMESYRFLKHHDSVEFRIYGGGEERGSLRALENECVRLMGFAEDVPALLASEISLVVIPSLIAEACPMTLLEALSFGVPVIGTNKGGLAELLKDGEVGFQVPPKYPAAIAEKIDHFIDHPDIYEEFSANALEYVKQFDLENYKKTVQDIFRSL